MRLISALLCSLISLLALAQERFQGVVDRNVWLLSDNAAALTLCTDSTASLAELAWNRSWGKWHDYSEGSSHNNVSARVQSFLHLSPSVMTYGSVSYDNFNGHRMQGSMLFDDGSLRPFDIVDYELGNAGDKHSEMVSLDGAVGWRPLSHLAIGAKADYTAATYVKYKDLRHTNTYMRLDLTAGFCLPRLAGGLIDAGLYGEYRRRVEELVLKTYGTSDIIYKSIIDYANFTGTVESFGETGFTDTGTGLPHLSEKKGAAVQLAFHLTDNIEWLNEFVWLTHDGRYGKKSQYTISYSRWNGKDFELRSHLKWSHNDDLHLVDFSWHSESLDADREVYIRENDDRNASVIYYKYFTPVKMNDKQQTTLRFAYAGRLKPYDGCYLWSFGAGAEIVRLEQTAYVYPKYSRQKISVYRPFAQLERRFMMHDYRHFSVGLSVNTQSGNGDLKDDGLLSGINSDKNSMEVQSTFQLQHYEWLTTRQWNASCSLGFGWQMNRADNVRPFVSMTYGLCKATDNSCIDGSSRHDFSLRLACEF